MNQYINHIIRHYFLLTCVLLCIASPLTAEDKLLTKEQILEDFSQLYQDLQLAHYDLFANKSKPEYDRAFAEWQNKITDAMTVRETKILFQQFMALGNIAHARIDLPMQDFTEFMQNGGRMFPMFFSIQGGAAFIDTVYVDNKWLQPGNEVVSINNKPVQTWLTDISSYISSDNQALAHTLIENTLPFYIWLIKGEQASFSVGVKTSEGKKQIVVSAVTSEQRQNFRKSATQHQDLSGQHAEIMMGNIGYLRPGPFYNSAPGAKDIWDNRAFVSFVDKTFHDFLDKDVNAVLIDLRNNPGGTNSFSDPIIAWFADKPFRFSSEFVIKVSPQSFAANENRLAVSQQKDSTSLQLKAFYENHKHGETFSMSLPEASPAEGKRYSGPVFVLINRYSYSNAVSFAAIVQDYGFGTVIGEKTADLATTYGAMEHFDLKHSGITVGYPKALIIRPNGDTKPDGVTPDVLLNTETGKNLLDVALTTIRHKLQ